MNLRKLSFFLLSAALVLMSLVAQARQASFTIKGVEDDALLTQLRAYLSSVEPPHNQSQYPSYKKQLLKKA